MKLTQDYTDMINLLNLHEVKFLIVGAYAMSKLGYTRNTFDIDIWVEKSENNAVKIHNALEDFGLPFSIEPDDFMADNSIIQIGLAPNRIDFLTDIDGVDFSEAWLNKIEFISKGKIVHSLSLDDLILNKSSTQRSKDKLDLEQLKHLAKTQKSKNIIKFDKNLTLENIIEDLENVKDSFNEVYNELNELIREHSVASLDDKKVSFEYRFKEIFNDIPTNKWSDKNIDNLLNMSIDPIDIDNISIFSNNDNCDVQSFWESRENKGWNSVEDDILEFAKLIDTAQDKIKAFIARKEKSANHYKDNDVLRLSEKTYEDMRIDIDNITQNAPDISIMGKDDSYYIASNSSEFDIVQAAYAYLQIDGDIPENLSKDIDMSKLNSNHGLSEEATSDLKTYVNDKKNSRG